MKTQLLEDIGESAASSLAPARIAGTPKAGKEVQHPAAAASAQPAAPRSARGVWRQKPAGETVVSAAAQPDPPAPPVEFDKVLEEIAALEARYVTPGRQHEPAITAVEAPPIDEPATPPGEASLSPELASHPAAPREPLFDFAPPAAEPQATAPLTPAPTWRTRSTRRYPVWAACLLAGALLIGGGRWFYQERDDAASPAQVADEARESPQRDQAPQRRVLPAQETTPRAGDGVAAVSANPPSTGLPPLVMLEPDPPAAAKVKQPAPVAPAAPAGLAPTSAVMPGKPTQPSESAAQRRTASPVTGAEQASAPDTSMTASLKACREHGYHAAQCIKQGCSVTKHGFVCRGR